MLEEQNQSAVHDVLRSPGKPLPKPVQTDMEARLGSDFSDVRLHTDSVAHTAAESVQAHAFTSGSDIVFQRGKYDPTSAAGRHTLAHELTHVVQQRSGPVAGTATGHGFKVSDPADRFEREAESTAARVMSDASGTTRETETEPDPGVQRSAVPGLVLQLASDDDAITPAPAPPVQDPGAEMEPITERDIEALQEYGRETSDMEVQRILNELIPMLERVRRFIYDQQLRSGGTTTKVPDPVGDRKYQVRYSGEDLEDRIAVLAHELVHVLVDSDQDADMLNYYPLPQLSGEKPESEEQRQQARLGMVPEGDRDRFRVHVLHNVERLQRLLPGSGLPFEMQQKAEEKLRSHTAQRPEHEYDAVLVHLLIWHDQHAEVKNSPFRQELAEMVQETRNWRSAGRVQPGEHPDKTLGGLAGDIGENARAFQASATRAAPAGRREGRLRQRVESVLDKIKRNFSHSRHRRRG